MSQRSAAEIHDDIRACVIIRNCLEDVHGAVDPGDMQEHSRTEQWLRELQAELAEAERRERGEGS